MKTTHILLLVALLATTHLTEAAVPQLISYQGSLTDSSGTPLDTTVSITFNIWPVPAGGSPDWTETHATVTVQEGLFAVQLGSVTTLPDLFAANRWLGITIGGDTEMIPRQQIISVAHAYRVGTVDGASGGAISGNVNITGKANIGSGNVNSGTFAFVAGQNDTASGNYATVSGGFSNAASGLYSTVSGGQDNTASNDRATVSGGNFNTASGSRATVSGGRDNTASATYATVSGGDINTASNDGATVGGGLFNNASGAYNTVGGGHSNVADSGYTTVSGGYNGQASDDYATVSGGSFNTASGDNATVSGGYNNTASGAYATVSGGYVNVAAGQLSFAAGYRARANHSRAFVWGSSTSGADSTASFSNYTFTARCANGARFYTAQTGVATGVSLPAGGGAWANLCDARQKRLHGGVNTSEVLQKVSELPLHRWSYKTQDESIRHIGPTAQDFYAQFGLGDDNTTISTLDPDGVALAAIQELAKQNLKLEIGRRIE